MTSTETSNVADGTLTLPARSVWVAVMTWVPLLKLGLHDQFPDANGPSVVHIVVASSNTVIKPVVSAAVPVIDVVAPTVPLGPVIVGASGAVRSITTASVADAVLV